MPEPMKPHIQICAEQIVRAIDELALGSRARFSERCESVLCNAQRSSPRRSPERQRGGQVARYDR